MTPKTVHVPEALRPVFAAAEKLVSEHFAKKRERPEHGTIDIEGERYVLMRASSLSERFFHIVRELYGEGRRDEADGFARNILFDLAHGVGRSDAELFARRTGATDPVERLSAGPVHFAFTGWARVELDDESTPSPDDDCYLVFDHPYSFESDAWLRAGVSASFPVCIMSSGYSSGWCEASFGIRLVATEILCRARGDEACRFIMAPPHRVEERVQAFVERHAGEMPALLRGDYQIPNLFARKALEDRLRRAHEELEMRVEERTAELQREMENRRQIERQLRQSQKMEAIGRLSGGIAHDFNNVLGVIMGCVSILERKHADEEVVDVIRQAANRAAELTGQLLAFSRSQILKPSPVDLNTVVAEGVRLFRHLLGAQIELVVVESEAPVVVCASEGGLQQVLLNLGLNARDAMPDGGRLTITVTQDGDHGVLVVEDTGIGMDEATRDRIFDPFFTTKPRDKGTGLGLSTAHGIVHQFNGIIDVLSDPGRGARFEVRLPVSDEDIDAVEVTSTGEHSDIRGVIMLVEDDDMLRGVVKNILENGGHETIVASDPTTALARIDERGEHFDLLLTDVVMPGMSGRKLAEEVLKRRPGMRLIYMTGYADDDDLRKGKVEAGACILHKPFTGKELLDQVRRLLSNDGTA